MLNCLKKIKNINKNDILVLDDVKENVELINAFLDDIKGVNVFEFYDPIKAEESIKEKKYDLLIFDIQMPDIDGYELAMKIKTDDSNVNKETPIIFVTGIYNSDLDKLKGYNIGSIDYILKPINYRNFISKISKYLSTGNKDKYFFDIKSQNIKKSLDI